MISHKKARLFSEAKTGKKLPSLGKYSIELKEAIWSDSQV